MTKRDYELIAGVLRQTKAHGENIEATLASHGVVMAIRALADAFQRDNPKFNRAKFFKAIES